MGRSSTKKGQKTRKIDITKGAGFEIGDSDLEQNDGSIEEQVNKDMIMAGLKDVCDFSAGNHRQSERIKSQRAAQEQRDLELQKTDEDVTHRRKEGGDVKLDIPQATKGNPEGTGAGEAGEKGAQQARPLYSQIHRKTENEESNEVHFYEPLQIEGISMGKIRPEEVKESIQWWQNTVVCKVIGGHPPFRFIEGFFRRRWGNRMDRMWMVMPGTFMVRFRAKEHAETALKQGTLLFDSKPVLIKEWSHDFNFEEPATFPVWVQLPNLNMVYWTPAIISKIVSPLGVPIKLDRPTLTKESLKYARVLMEVKVSDNLPNEVAFIDENDVIRHQQVVFEWKPIKCNGCQMMGHSLEECKKKEQPETQNGGPAPQTDGWQTQRRTVQRQRPAIFQEPKGVYIATGVKHRADTARAEPKEATPVNKQDKKALDQGFQTIMKKIGPVSILQREGKQHKLTASQETECSDIMLLESSINGSRYHLLSKPPDKKLEEETCYQN